MSDLLADASARARRYLEGLADRRVSPPAAALDRRAAVTLPTGWG